MSSKSGVKMTLKSAVNQHCKDCIYDVEFKGGGSWLEQIENCTSVECALYEFRPVTVLTRKANSKKKESEFLATLSAEEKKQYLVEKEIKVERFKQSINK